MKIIGIGDLVTDCYFVNDEFKGVCGGMTSQVQTIYQIGK